MRHTKVIQPTDSSKVNASSLPDRTDLSKLYLSTKNSSQQKTTDNDAVTPNPIVINRLLVSFLLSVPFIATYLAAIYIYQGTEASIVNPDPLFPLLRFFVSGLWLLSCVVSIRILVKRFYNYNTPLSGFIIIYLFFAMPMIKITHDLFPVDIIGIATTIIVWLIANYLTVLYITWSFNQSNKSSASKIATIAFPVAVLVIFAAIT